MTSRLLIGGTIALVFAAAAYAIGFYFHVGSNEQFTLAPTPYILKCLLYHASSSFHSGSAENWLTCQSQITNAGLIQEFLTRAYLIEGPIFAAALCFLFVAFLIWDSEPITFRHLSGGQLFEFQQAVTKLSRSLKKQLRKYGNGIEISEGVSLSANHDLRHFLIRGGTGSGKTQIMLRIVLGWLEREEPIVVLDLKGSLMSQLGVSGSRSEPVLLNPGDARSFEWVIGRDCVDEADANELAAHLIPETQNNPFFPEAAQSILVGIILKLQTETPRQWSWRDLYAVTCLGPAEIEKICCYYYPHSSSLFEGDTRSSTMDVLSTISSKLKVVRVLSQAWPEGTPQFSAKDWLRGGKRKRNLVILGWNEKSNKISAAWVAAFSSLLGGYIASPEMPESRKKSLNIALDEFGNLPKMQGLAAAVNMGRSKGLCVALVIQDVGQLKEVYGQHVASGWPSTIGTHIVCRLGSGPSNDEISKFIGTKEIETLQISYSQGPNGNTTSKQWVKKTEQIITPNKLLEKLQVDDEGFNFLLFGIDQNTYLLRNKFIALPELRAPHIPLKLKPKAPLTDDKPVPNSQKRPSHNRKRRVAKKVNADGLKSLLQNKAK
ncbi:MULTISPECIES: type IV secretion system DNA-binding domain-containing protein [unclassified Pseudovibrio]|uniref:type IV secretion system DNA-binding domain-containing protein n=1 Tax=unclassified Pseudovibrio TaxID=2627060 RepID=UPI0007AE77CD|nr:MULTISPECIES: type IV secretion system DNA-binding domain-containing protein [unclassified Pseudovibrio]KZK94448.1 Coupling protein TraD [Pseudovibrio sp. W74]KZL07192.1 Coupling protein TraD [Pseudovibrio sp. Ad14]